MEREEGATDKTCPKVGDKISTEKSAHENSSKFIKYYLFIVQSNVKSVTFSKRA